MQAIARLEAVTFLDLSHNAFSAFLPDYLFTHPHLKVPLNPEA